MVCVVLEGPITVKKEAMTMAKLDKKMAKRMNGEIAQKKSQNNQQHTLKMVTIQLELERQRRESQEMHTQLMKYFAQMNVRLQIVYVPAPKGSHVPPLPCRLLLVMHTTILTPHGCKPPLMC